MNEELMITETMELNNEVEVMDCDEQESSGSGLGKLLVGGLVVGAGALVALGIKNKHKLEERKIEKLRKKGYVIYKEDEVEVLEEDVEDEFEDEEDSEE